MMSNETDAPWDRLLRGLLHQGFEPKKAEALVHALVDINKSMTIIYDKLLPELMSVLDQPSDAFKDKLWSLREEFRHVDYHMRDAELTEL